MLHQRPAAASYIKLLANQLKETFSLQQYIAGYTVANLGNFPI